MCSECRCDRLDRGLCETTVVQYRMGDIPLGKSRSIEGPSHEHRLSWVLDKHV